MKKQENPNYLWCQIKGLRFKEKPSITRENTMKKVVEELNTELKRSFKYQNK